MQLGIDDKYIEAFFNKRRIYIKMGTPNTIHFRCPHCNKQVSVQRPGDGLQLLMVTMCECEIGKFDTSQKPEATCPICNMVITFKVEEGYKKVKILKPIIKV